MRILKAKITRVEVDESGLIQITVEMADDTGFYWSKTHPFYTTEKINLEDFKKRIVEDAERDIKGLEKVKEIQDQIGKEFQIEINEH